MNNNKLKEIYEAHPSDWVCYALTGANTWIKVWDTDHDDIQLIAKQHEHIADAVIANPDVEVEYLYQYNGWKDCEDFFSHYRKDIYSYRLKETKPVNFNGGFIIASQEAYDLLVKLYEPSGTLFELKGRVRDCLFIDNENNLSGATKEWCIEKLKLKQFYINNGELSWDESIQYCIEHTETQLNDGVCSKCSKDIENLMNTLPREKINIQLANTLKEPQINSMEDLNELPIVQEGYDFGFSKLCKKDQETIERIFDKLVGEEDVRNRDSSDNKNSCSDNIHVGVSIPDSSNDMEGLKENENTSNNTSFNDGISNRNDTLQDIISITDDNGKVYEFEKPEFEILGLFYCNESKMLLGTYKEYDGGMLFNAMWTEKGSCRSNTKFDLTLIKPKWYEGASITKPIYCFVMDDDWSPSETPILCQGFSVVGGTATNLLYNYNCDGETFDEVAIECVRLATKAERDSLYCEGK